MSRAPVRNPFASPAARPYNSQIPGAQNPHMIHFPVPEALTFDDVSAASRPFRCYPCAGQHPDPAYPQHPDQHPDCQRRHGHRHRVAHGDRARPAGRPRHRSSQPQHRAAGQRSRQGKALRKRHDRRPGHHVARRQGLRRARRDAQVQDLRRARSPRKMASWSASSPTATCASKPASTFPSAT